jgi:PAS domain S-box-containing protein
MTAEAAPRASRVLIVDDNRAIHEDFQKIFQRDDRLARQIDQTEAALFDEVEPAVERPEEDGFQLDSGYQGESGLDLVRQALESGRPYAMAFMDVRMPPGWDGVETTAKIWELDPDIQIVICTAYSDYAWDEMLAKLGKTDRFVILKKPFDNIEVLQLAHSLTRKWRLLQESKAKLAGLEVLVAARTAEIFQEQEKFKAIFDNSPEGIFQISVDGRFLSANPALAAICGYSFPAELIAQVTDPRTQLYADAERWEEFQRRMREEGSVGDFELEIKCKDGSKKWVSQAACKVAKPGDPAFYYQGFLVDVTARKQARRERDLMEAHLQQGHKLESVGRLASGIAHEINNPLQCIGGNVDFADESFRDFMVSLAAESAPASVGSTGPAVAGGSDPGAETAYFMKEIPAALDQARQGVERVAKIVRALGDFSSRPKAGKIATDLNRAIETILTVSRGEWGEAAAMVTDFDGGLPPVHCWPDELNQALLNVIVNAAHAIADAAKAAPGVKSAKGTIRITTRRLGSLAEIRVSDMGPGVPEPIRGRIFDPFFTTKEVGRGAGLGLTVARSIIVNKHAGQITFETSAGQGTTFIIRLPLGPGEK